MPSQSMMAMSSQQSQTSLDKNQSLEIVKIFLNASLACICHTRELLDWQSQCFRTRFIDQISLDSDDIYHAFCGPESTRPGKSQEIRVLVRGVSRRADAILDMIEHGVFSAIEKAYLDVLQIFVATNKGGSKAIQETYTYSFAYHDNAVASVELKEHQQFLSLSDAQRSFKSAIRNLLRSVKDLPNLPGACSLGMSIAYNSHCPPKYEPTGFIDSKNHKVLPEDWSDLWDKHGETVSTFEAAHHSLNIAAKNAIFGYQTASQMQDTALSKQLQNLQKTSSGRHPGLVSTLTLPASPQHPMPIARQLQDGIEAESPRLTRSTSRKVQQEKASTPKLPKPNHVADLKNIGGLRNPLHGLTIRSKNRRQRNIIPAKIAKAIVHAHCLDFEAEEGETFFDSVQLDRGVIYRIDRGRTVRCECGSREETDSMLYCNLCNTKQHTRCYGLSSIRPSSVPEQHLCYSCLLLPDQENKLHSMVNIVHVRLALMYISQLKSNQFHVDDSFTWAVFGSRCNSKLERLHTLVDLLKSEDLVAEQQDGSLEVLKADSVLIDRIQTHYLDPMANIEHMYQISQTKGGGQQEVQEELDKYARGRDYKFGHGVDNMTVLNAFGEEVVWWGFFDESTGKPGESGRKRKALIDTQDEPSPRRRKISISYGFIALDRSTPVDEDDFRRHAVDSIRDRDASVASSAVTQV